MSSAFFEYNIATSGLFAAKAGLEITSNNVANSAVKGYSRQVVNQRASSTIRVAGIGNVGTGTEIFGVSQIRSSYLDKKYWSQTSVRNEYATKNSQLEVLEGSFNALSESGLTKKTNDFFNKISELSFDSSSSDYRQGFVDATKQLVSDINYYAGKLQELQTDANNQIETIISRINVLGEEISRLSAQIRTNEIEGSNSNDLRDQRARLIDELSEYVNIETKEIVNNGNTSDTTFLIFINGQEFLNGQEFRPLKLVQRAEKVNGEDIEGIFDVCWSNGVKLETKALKGSLKGYIDVRDGNGETYKGTPYYMDKLNQFVRGLAAAMNEGTSYQGKTVTVANAPAGAVVGSTISKDATTGTITLVEVYDEDGVLKERTTVCESIDGLTGHINGYNEDGAQGNLLFSYKDGAGNIVKAMKDATGNDIGIDYSKLNALNFSLSSEVLESTKNLAASVSDTSQGNKSDNEILLQFVKLKENKSLFKEGSPLDFTNAISSVLALEKSEAANFEKYYKDSSEVVENQRIQVSGVSLNEEITNILKYQQLYKVSAKLVSVIDRIYEITINSMGA